MSATQPFERDGVAVVAFPKLGSGAYAKRRRTYRRFKAALGAFSESPNTDNAVRYLAASRALRPASAGLVDDGDLPPAA